MKQLHVIDGVSRRAFIGGAAAAVAAAALVRRSRADEPAQPDEVVLYCSADSGYARPVLDAFAKATSGSVVVKPVFDTEATKTTGLVQRLLAEKDRPRADVWWSSEAFGTIRLAGAGVLEPYTSEPTERAFEPVGGWPARLRATDKSWYGFARRVRVVVHNTKHVSGDAVPTRLAALTDPRFKARVGIARPEFGTTRGHMAALLHACGEAAFERWLQGLAANEVRLLDGNATVVRAVGSGELHVGLTDTDDVAAGIRNGWPVAGGQASSQLEAVTHDRAPSVDPHGRVLLPFPESAMQMPHTVALVKRGERGPVPDGARKLIDFLLGAEADRLLSSGEAASFLTYDPLLTEPAAARLADEQNSAKADPASLPLQDLDLEAAAAHADRAIELCTRILPR